MPQVDLLVRGGHVLDPGCGLDAALDVAIAKGRIAAIAPDLPVAGAAQVLDASGSTVVPGLIDLHTHLGFKLHGQVVDADEVCPPAGVTTAVDMGTTGAFTVPWYRDRVLAHSTTRLLPFLNIASLGTLGAHSPYYVERYGQYIDVEDTVRAIGEHRDYIRGIKVFGASDLSGRWPLPALRAARQVAERVDLPIAVHVSGVEPPLEDLLPLLRAGDIMTHCFTGHAQRILDDAGRLRTAVREARARGVLFDLGHGNGSFAFAVARRALEQGFVPDTISTDLYYLNRVRPVKDLLTTMSKMLCLGLTLPDVLARTTRAPAEALREPSLGSLRVGAPADVAVLRLREGQFEYVDTVGETLAGRYALECHATVRAGRLIFQKEGT
ncbi:MAG: amidohydrolase/deacetylase family metallohydrolase [Chloroflexi bacterium]|nr:amidohydrolase/deacetylase family metallohydrolase [Chloroflexota bacterium]